MLSFHLTNDSSYVFSFGLNSYRLSSPEIIVSAPKRSINEAAVSGVLWIVYPSLYPPHISCAMFPKQWYHSFPVISEKYIFYSIFAFTFLKKYQNFSVYRHCHLKFNDIIHISAKYDNFRATYPVVSGT